MKSEFYVHPAGDDTAAGSPSAPFATIARAVEALREVRGGQGGGTVRVGPGVYRLSSPLVLDARDSGIVIAGDPDAPATLTSDRLLTGASPVEDEADLPIHDAARGRLWRIPIAPGRPVAALLVGGKPQPRAKWPTHDDWERWPGCEPGEGSRQLVIPAEAQPRHTNMADVELNVLSTPYTKWINYLCPVEQTDGDRVTVGRELVPNAYLKPDKWIPWRAENALSVLREPGQWCVDTRAGAIYYWPAEGVDLSRAEVSVPELSNLVQVQGDDGAPVRDVALRHLRLVGTNRAAGAPAGALELHEAEACVIEDCAFEQLGGVAIRGGRGTFGNRIARCTISDCDRGGIAIAAPTPSRRTLSGHNVIEENTITRCGRVDWHASGIALGGSSHNIVRNNDVFDLPYAAIAVGGSRMIFFVTNTQGGQSPDAIRLEDLEPDEAAQLDIVRFKRWVSGHNVIEGNRVWDVMRRLDDGAAIYCHASHHDQVRGNLVARTHRPSSHGLYFDDDQTDSLMEDNVVVDCPPGDGTRGSAIHIHDNALNTIRRNIVANAPRAYTMPASYGGHRVSENFFLVSESATAPTLPQRDRGRYQETRYDAGEPYNDRNTWWSADEGSSARAVLEAIRSQGADVHGRIAAPDAGALARIEACRSLGGGRRKG